MMAVHEAGHCAGVWLSGGAIDSVEIPLFGFSQTRYAENPHPLFTTWAGPAGGTLIGLILLGLATVLRGATRHAVLFFAGFSLIANGLYIGLGGFDRAGDCGDLLRNGASLWQLIVFGLTSTVAGFSAWHRIGPIKGWFSTPRG